MNDGFPSNMPLAAGAILARIAGGTTYDINGGTIDGTVIGGTTPAAVACTTLTASGVLLANGNEIRISGTSPQYWLNETDGASDEKKILVLISAGVYRLRMLNDAETVANDVYSVTRSGATPLAMTISPSVTIGGSAPGTPSAGQVLIGGGDIKAAGGLTLGALMTLTATTASLAIFNSTHADGAGFAVQNNGTGNGYFGSYKYCFGSGNATDFALISAQSGSKLTLGGAGTRGIELDGSTTAGTTRLLVWDVDNGTMERVTVGAADSGGVGYKVLRIPN